MWVRFPTVFSWNVITLIFSELLSVTNPKCTGKDNREPKTQTQTDTDSYSCSHSWLLSAPEIRISLPSPLHLQLWNAAVCNFCPSWWQTGSDTSGINSYFLTCCWVAYMLPVEISTFFSTNIHHCKALWNCEAGESCQWSHAVNKVEKRVTGIHRKGKDSVCISAFCELRTTVQCSSCRTLPSQAVSGEWGWNGEFFSCTSTILDLSFSHWNNWRNRHLAKSVSGVPATFHH